MTIITLPNDFGHAGKYHTDKLARQAEYGFEKPKETGKDRKTTEHLKEERKRFKISEKVTASDSDVLAINQAKKKYHMGWDDIIHVMRTRHGVTVSASRLSQFISKRRHSLSPVEAKALAESLYIKLE